MELAPWALTMMRRGGTAIRPTQAVNEKADDLLPNRNISLWPHSRLHDARLHLEDEFIALKPGLGATPFKIGAFSYQGWIAYWLEGILFRKTFAVQPGLAHADHQCNAELYCDSHFVELESLGPLCKLEPGATASFTETWELFDSLAQEFLSEAMVNACLEKAT
jgi:hypothetical protein